MIWLTGLDKSLSWLELIRKLMNFFDDHKTPWEKLQSLEHLIPIQPDVLRNFGTQMKKYCPEIIRI